MIDFFFSQNFLSPFPYLGKVFVCFFFLQRNKELLIGVGRRDFELGSAPAFPVVRVEIDLEEWHTTLSLSHSELGDTIKKKKKVFKTFPWSSPLFVV